MEQPIFPDEPYHGVRALFNGDYQAVSNFVDRKDWIVESKNVITFMGEKTLDLSGVFVESE